MRDFSKIPILQKNQKYGQICIECAAQIENSNIRFATVAIAMAYEVEPYFWRQIATYIFRKKNSKKCCVL